MYWFEFEACITQFENIAQYQGCQSVRINSIKRFK